jgi:hypothetical protein
MIGLCHDISAQTATSRRSIGAGLCVDLSYCLPPPVVHQQTHIAFQLQPGGRVVGGPRASLIFSRGRGHVVKSNRQSADETLSNSPLRTNRDHGSADHERMFQCMRSRAILRRALLGVPTMQSRCVMGPLRFALLPHIVVGVYV